MVKKKKKLFLTAQILKIEAINCVTKACLEFKVHIPKVQTKAEIKITQQSK